MTERLWRPVDIASLAAFRILFGVLMFVGLTRFALSGWIDRLYVRPTFFFEYFHAVEVWPPWGLYLHFGALAVLALMIAVGLFYRFASVAFFIGFTYVQLMDVTNYLNHYYLVVLLAGIIALLPLNAAWSLDVRRRPELARVSVPGWMIDLLRFQVAVVYINAALAKAGPDWLLHGQPLAIWLAARAGTPIFGPLFAEPWAPLAFSWAGFLYDLTIVGWLSWRRSRPLAYVTVVVFHVLTRVLFDIGMFPFIMMVATTLFFDPSWPRRFLRKRPIVEHVWAAEPRRWVAVALACWLAIQVAVPLRTHFYGGNVLWHEQGMRWSWRVMVREKNGSITYHVTVPSRSVAGATETYQVSPHDYLEWRQVNEMSSQPDLILQLAKHIASDFERRGFGHAQVRVDAWVSLNGRAPALMIDPNVDLTQVPDSVLPADWILPAPEGPPIRIRPVVAAR